MKKFFLVTLFSLYATAFSWDYQHNFQLKKDQVAHIEVIKRVDESKRDLTLRWTLYQNERLVLLVKYDGFPTQYILQKEYKRNSIRIALRDDYSEESQRCFLLLRFKSFDEGKKIALLEASIMDVKKRVEIRFIDPKNSKG
jgi:hypothetical protein